MPDPFVILKQDHRKAEAMLKQLSSSKNPGPRRASTVAKLTAALELHMDVEERLLYPLVAEELGSEPAKEANIEHTLAREGLANLDEYESQPGFGATVAMLTAGIKHHVQEEEREMFPKLKHKLDRAQLDELAAQITAAKRRTKQRA
jgi:hemerythrin-like domain-containing protein